MEQRFLTQEELQKREAEKHSQRETLVEASQETAAPIGKQLDPAVVNDLMRQLNEEEGSRSDPRWMAPQERETLLEQLTRRARSQKSRRQASFVVYMIGTTLFISLNLAYVFGHMSRFPLMTLSLVTCYIVAGLCMRLAERRWGRAAEQMARFDDPRTIGPLIEALALRDQMVVSVAEKSLVGLLPRLQASEADSITETQRECLYKRLKIQNAQTSADFLIAALQALEQIGDVKALPCVEALAASADKTKNATRVREAALHCLPFLRARTEQKKLSDSLLRASSGQETPSNSLLRPAADSSPTDPQLLLRATEPNG